ncbi:MAG: MYXO-CTERM sorting domain-containing protein [Polyangiales bacterium]
MTLRSVALALGLALLPVRARANGRFPFAQQVVLGPGARSDVVVLRTTFGLLVSRDAGATFHWVCEDSMFFPYVPGLMVDPAVEVTAEGRVALSFESGVHSFTDGCAVRRQAATADHDVIDLAATPSGDTLYGVESTAGSPSYVLRGGVDLELSRVGAPLAGMRFATVEVAPSDARRVYLSAVEDTTRVPRLLRSDDGGDTVRALTVPESLLGDGAYVSGVDPTNPDALFVRAVVGFGSDLLRSTDGGASFHRVATTRDAMLGFAISDDGRTVWYGSQAEGLYRSTDGGESFERVNPLPTLCLRQHAGALWACTDWISQPWALGRSMDGGATFTPVLRFSEVAGPPECASRDEGAAICVERWPLLQSMLTDPEPPPDAGLRDAAVEDDTAPTDVAPTPDLAPAEDVPAVIDVGARDAGVVAPPATSSCDCRATPRATRVGPWLSLVAVGLAIGLRRRRFQL